MMARSPRSSARVRSSRMAVDLPDRAQELEVLRLIDLRDLDTGQGHGATARLHWRGTVIQGAGQGSDSLSRQGRPAAQESRTGSPLQGVPAQDEAAGVAAPRSQVTCL